MRDEMQRGDSSTSRTNFRHVSLRSLSLPLPAVRSSKKETEFFDIYNEEEDEVRPLEKGQREKIRRSKSVNDASQPKSNPIAHSHYSKCEMLKEHSPVSKILYREMIRHDKAVGKAYEAHYNKLEAEGKILKVEFTEQKLGFTLVLARLRQSPRPRLLIEETFPNCSVYNLIRPTDELLAINDSILVPVDIEAFPALIAKLQKMQRPLLLTFAKTKGRDLALDKQERRRRNIEAKTITAPPALALRPQKEQQLKQSDEKEEIFRRSYRQDASITHTMDDTNNDINVEKNKEFHLITSKSSQQAVRTKSTMTETSPSSTASYFLTNLASAEQSSAEEPEAVPEPQETIPPPPPPFMKKESLNHNKRADEHSSTTSLMTPPQRHCNNLQQQDKEEIKEQRATFENRNTYLWQNDSESTCAVSRMSSNLIAPPHSSPAKTIDVPTHNDEDEELDQVVLELRIQHPNSTMTEETLLDKSIPGHIPASSTHSSSTLSIAHITDDDHFDKYTSCCASCNSFTNTTCTQAPVHPYGDDDDDAFCNTACACVPELAPSPVDPERSQTDACYTHDVLVAS